MPDPAPLTVDSLTASRSHSPGAGPGARTAPRPPNEGREGSPRSPGVPAGAKAKQSGPGGDGSRTGGVEARVGAIACAVAQGAVGVLGGTRPAHQMSRWLDQDSYDRLEVRASLMRSAAAAPKGHRIAPPAAQRRNRGATVRAARLCRVSDTAFEAALVVHDCTRARAVALRVEQRRGSWRITALEIG